MERTSRAKILGLACPPSFYIWCCHRLAARWLHWFGGQQGLLHRLPFAGGWTDGRDLPAPSGRTFREFYREQHHE